MDQGLGRDLSLIDGRSSIAVRAALLTPLIHLFGLPVGFLVWGGPGVIAFVAAFFIALIVPTYVVTLAAHLLLAVAFRAIGRFRIALPVATGVNVLCVSAFLAGSTLEKSGAMAMGWSLALSGQLALSLLAWRQTRAQGG